MRTEDIKKMGQAYLQVLEKSQKEAMDAVNKKALKKDFDDREDKDIDNDGDEDESDEYLHKKRKAISKAIKKNGDKADNDTEVQTQEAKDLDDKNVEKLVKHDCATHVEHAEFGAGVCIPGEHTLVESSDGEGYVTHYDVMFDHGIEKDVMVEDLKITKSEAHIHAGKKMKKESVELDEAEGGIKVPAGPDHDRKVKRIQSRAKQLGAKVTRVGKSKDGKLTTIDVKGDMKVIYDLMKLRNEEVELDEALNPKDKKVVDAFYDGKSMDGKMLSTDGKTLEKSGMGRQTIATNSGGKFKIVAKMDGKSTQDIVGYIKKSFPKNVLDEAATAQQKPDEKTRDTYEKQLSTRKGEKDFVDQHKSEVPVAADEPKIDAMNFKTFKAMTKKSPARSADQTKGDTNIVKGGTPVGK